LETSICKDSKTLDGDPPPTFEYEEKNRKEKLARTKWPRLMSSFDHSRKRKGLTRKKEVRKIREKKV